MHLGAMAATVVMMVFSSPLARILVLICLLSMGDILDIVFLSSGTCRRRLEVVHKRCNLCLFPLCSLRCFS